MIPLLLTALLNSPHAPAGRIAWIVVAENQESRVVKSEWRNEAAYFRDKRWQVQSIFDVRFIDHSRTNGITQVPCLVVAQEQYPIRTAYSGNAIWDIHFVCQWFDLGMRNDEDWWEKEGFMP